MFLSIWPLFLCWKGGGQVYSQTGWDHGRISLPIGSTTDWGADGAEIKRLFYGNIYCKKSWIFTSLTCVESYGMNTML